MLHHQMEYSITNFQKVRLCKHLQAWPTRLGVSAINKDQVSWPGYMTKSLRTPQPGRSLSLVLLSLQSIAS